MIEVFFEIKFFRNVANIATLMNIEWRNGLLRCWQWFVYVCLKNLTTKLIQVFNFDINEIHGHINRMKDDDWIGVRWKANGNSIRTFSQDDWQGWHNSYTYGLVCHLYSTNLSHIRLHIGTVVHWHWHNHTHTRTKSHRHKQPQIIRKFQ